jgi:hypothetical protein
MFSSRSSRRGTGQISEYLDVQYHCNVRKVEVKRVIFETEMR